MREIRAVALFDHCSTAGPFQYLAQASYTTLAMCQMVSATWEFKNEKPVRKITLYVKPRKCTYQKKVLLGYKSTVPIPPSHQTSCAVILTHARAGDLVPSLKPDTWIDYSGTRQQVHYVRTYYSTRSPTKIPRHIIPVSVPANLLRFIHLRDLVVLPPDPGDAVLQEADSLQKRSLETDAHIKCPNILLCYSKLEFKYTWKSSGSPAMSSSPFASGLSGWRPRSAKVIGLSLHFSIRFSNICSKYSN